uniref:Uncharacterized protein n=1 Tax=Aegilops tauschii subsp. strangulata TaxID=200361 RepID=A0A453J4H6_AEGTS
EVRDRSSFFRENFVLCKPHSDHGSLECIKDCMQEIFRDRSCDVRHSGQALERKGVEKENPKLALCVCETKPDYYKKTEVHPYHHLI